MPIPTQVMRYIALSIHTYILYTPYYTYTYHTLAICTSYTRIIHIIHVYTKDIYYILYTYSYTHTYTPYLQ